MFDVDTTDLLCDCVVLALRILPMLATDALSSILDDVRGVCLLEEVIDAVVLRVLLVGNGVLLLGD